MESLNRMKKLVKILNEARKDYYHKNESNLSDFEYDKLYDELSLLEKKENTIMSNSPTQNVGYEVISKLEKISHSKKMLSLDKTKDIEKLKSFLKENEGILSLKLDGLTIVLTYENGNLTQAVTRGNGIVGENIINNVKMFKNIPVKIPTKDKLVIRGEAVISFEDFNKINKLLPDDKKFKNPRNLCSGSVRQLNNEITEKRNINFISFWLAQGNTKENLKSNNLKYLKSLGFDIVDFKIVTKDNIEKSVEEFKNNNIIKKFATDGLVLTFNSINYSNSLGETSKFPKDSIAFKWADELAKTKLLNVEWSVSRTGLINPVAVFESVELEGTTVSRASLHNITIIENLKLGLGDEITVYKANMIIPQIAENLTKSNTLKIPKNCPSCGEKAEIIKIREGKTLKCLNENCLEKICESISHFVSRDAMNITGLSNSTIKKLVKNNLIKSYADIYNLCKQKEEFLSMYKSGEKTFNNLINAIEQSKNVNLENFIYALGIENVGLQSAKLLVSHFNNDLNKIINSKENELTEIEGFGEIVSNSVLSYFKNSKNIEKITKIAPLLKFKEKNNKLSILKNKIFVITGNVEFFKNRKEIIEKIEDLGGKVSNNVSEKTDYLINNDINSNSSKNKKAKELNINIITEKDFIKIIE